MADSPVVKLRLPSADDADALRRIYFEAFPPQERRPWHSLWAAESGLHLLAIDCDGTTVGLLSWWDLGLAVYIEHFAVDSELRGSGVGSRALKAFLSDAGKPAVLEVEPPEPSATDTLRRVAFYRRHGFHVLDCEYIQPPYAPGLPSVELKLMSTDRALNASHLTATLHCTVYGV